VTWPVPVARRGQQNAQTVAFSESLLWAFFNTPSQTETTGLRLCSAISHSQATDLYAVP